MAGAFDALDLELPTVSEAQVGRQMEAEAEAEGGEVVAPEARRSRAQVRGVARLPVSLTLTLTRGPRRSRSRSPSPSPNPHSSLTPAFNLPSP